MRIAIAFFISSTLAFADDIKVPKKTILAVSLEHELEAKQLRKGREFKARLAHALTSPDGSTLIEAGSEVRGKVEEADDQHLKLAFRDIRTARGRRSLEASIIGVDAEDIRVEDGELEAPGKSKKKRAVSAGATAAGVLTGGVAGAATKGIGRVLFGGGGKELKLKKGTLLRIELTKELKLKI